MKIKDLLPFIDTNYLLVADKENSYFVEYVNKSELSNKVQNANLIKIEPVPALKKSLFEEINDDNNYVIGLKLIYSLSDDVEPVEETVDEEIKEEANYKSYSIPFGGIPGLDNLINPGMLSSLLSSDTINQIINSESFQNFMANQDITEMFNNEDFINMMSNGGIGNIFNSNDKDTDSDLDDDVDEYEEI